MVDRIVRVGVLLALAVLQQSCGGERAKGVAGPTAPKFPTAVLVTGGDDQQGAVGEELATPLTVKVVDSTGEPIGGQVVNFRVVAGGGSVFAGAAVTDGAGRAAERWTLGTTATDSQRIEARAVHPETGAAIVFATFRARTTPGLAAQLQRTSPDSQNAQPGKTVPAPSVVIRDKYGNPVPGVEVSFTVTAGRGTVSPAKQQSDSLGRAAAQQWRLGAAAGTNTVVVSTGGVSSTTFTAFATVAPAALPQWTVMVYMAADNSLAIHGVHDIDEMEAAGTNPNVQVVVQAEFSSAELSRYGCTSAACINRPNFNTFRYAITGQGGSSPGPNGIATDIGNVDMTDPAQLAAFVSWAKVTYPAQKYALVLWNHGGGYSGLLEDITSAGGHFMPLADLPNALAPSAPLDLIDFDMCLMGGYETLSQLAGIARFTTFSEETVPGPGNPYTAILKPLMAQPGMDARTLARVFVDQFDASYAYDRSPTTKSAFDLNGFADFENALDAVANGLNSRLTVLRTALQGAAVQAQRYSTPNLADLGDLMDSLKVRVTDATLMGQLATLQAKLTTTTFRVTNKARNGTSNGRSVTRSTGLNILFPTGTAYDPLPDRGPGSFAEYQKALPSKGWTTLLASWVAASSTAAIFDQGPSRFETYLVWDSASVKTGVDLDFLVMEPDGRLYMPYLGTVTPNGHLTPDSYSLSSWFEGYLTNRFALKGRYRFYALLFDDPMDKQPLYDMAYRFDQVSPFNSLYDPNYPRLSFRASWLDDPNATFEKIDAGLYSDFAFAAYLDMGLPSSSVMISARDQGVMARPKVTDRASESADRTKPTQEQIDVIRRNLGTIRVRRTTATARTPAEVRLPSRLPMPGYSKR
jgi:hypothetical protein